MFHQIESKFESFQIESKSQLTQIQSKDFMSQYYTKEDLLNTVNNNKGNKLPSDEEKIHPILAFFMSVLIPGIGQLSNGTIVKGVIFFFVWSIFWILHFSPWWFVVAIISGIDAARDSFKFRTKPLT